MKKKTERFNARLTPRAHELLETLARELGISKTAVAEQAIRLFARCRMHPGDEH